MSKISRLFWLFVLTFYQIIFPFKKAIAFDVITPLICPTSDFAELPDRPLSQTQPTIPSLWLAEEIYGEYVLSKWFVDASQTWVILIVNQLVWKEMDYIDRYQFVSKFGAVSRQYGYNTVVCNLLEEKGKAAYFCNFDADELVCHLKLD